MNMRDLILAKALGGGGGGGGIRYEIVQTLPATGENGVIYLVPKEGETDDIYDEYMYINSAWEKIGSTGVTPTVLYEEKTYAEIKALRDSGNLVPGTFYRMTDYNTIITGSYDLSVLGAQGYLHNAVSAGHQFDLVLLATDEGHLSEDAKAVLHEGDTYFTGKANLDAWEIKYDLDNNTDKYAWANTNGKGVIWWMKDEWNNQAGYDFKNIQFLRYALKKADPQGDYTPSATSLVYDAATQPNRYGSMYQIFTALQAYMKDGSYVNPWIKGNGKADYDFAVGSNILGVIQFAEPNAQYMAAFNADLYYTFDYLDETSTHIDASFNLHTKIPCTENYISLEKDPVSAVLFNVLNKLGLGGSVWETNSIYVAGLQSAVWDDISHNYLSGHNWCNTFGDNCYSNTFGDTCSSNTFGDSCYSNTFGDSCYSNTFGDSCYSNTFGNDCYSNTFGNDCYSNTFGDDCDNNTFGNSCDSNTFGNSCDNNTFGNNCDNNTFGNSCYSNTFGNSCYSNTFGNSCDNNTFGNNCNSNTFGNSCDNNTFGNNCNSNTFGDSCGSNTFGKLDSNNNFIGNMWYLHCNDHVMGITATTTEYGTNSSTIKVLENYNDTSGHATLITKTGYNQETVISTTDGGSTWA